MPDDDHKNIRLFDLYFPEVKTKFNSIDVSEYKQTWLSETEKILRRLRVVSLKIDRLSDSLIKKIRHAHTQERAKSVEAQEKIIDEIPAQIEELYDLGEMLKKEEQKLIVEIARNPKKVEAYLALGDAYVKLGQFEDAKNSYETCLKLDAENEVYKKKLDEANAKIAADAEVAK